MKSSIVDDNSKDATPGCRAELSKTYPLKADGPHRADQRY